MRKFTLKAGMDAGNSAYEYRYSLWLPMTGYLQPVISKNDQSPSPFPCDVCLCENLLLLPFVHDKVRLGIALLKPPLVSPYGITNQF